MNTGEELNMEKSCLNQIQICKSKFDSCSWWKFKKRLFLFQEWQDSVTLYNMFYGL
jgi:hypothetical protein